MPYGESYDAILKAPATEKVYLVVKARIDWPKAGAADIMRIDVNGVTITKERLVNKNLYFTYADGRRYSYYEILNPYSWTLFYSPDFASNNIAKSNYRVIEGNAYTFKFDVTDIVKKGEMNEITIYHTGPYLVHRPQVTQKKINEIKSTKIVVGQLNFEAVGAPISVSGPKLGLGLIIDSSIKQGESGKELYQLRTMF